MLLESYIYIMPDFIDIFLLLLIAFVVIGLYIIRKKGSPENDIYKSNETLLKKYNIKTAVQFDLTEVTDSMLMNALITSGIINGTFKSFVSLSNR